MSERVDFLEILFGIEIDQRQVLREQAVCVVCGRGGFHAHDLERDVDDEP